MEISVGVQLVFVNAGPVTLDDRGDLVFPRLPAGPGVYRLELRAADALQVYVGQAANLRRRAWEITGDLTPTTPRRGGSGSF
ncbi:GIY-YIG nuclease family protein [Pseudonocardia dioxanivorans]|uniref:hypothetical protein n=1 Tax=Pseudonocardia dioxanivorans TaxID=240495 RepID=UPI00131A4E91|nr:hypothetical protein [Pseudonocardia dioxanivorans]